MLIQSFLLLWAMLHVLIPGSQTMTTAVPSEGCGQGQCTFESSHGKHNKTGICSDIPIEGYHDVGQEQCGNGCNCYSTETKVCSASRNSPLKPIQDPSFCATFTDEECLQPDAMQYCPMKCNCLYPWHLVGKNQCIQAIHTGDKLTWSVARVYCNRLEPGATFSDLVILNTNNLGDLREHILANKFPMVHYWIGGSNLYQSLQGVSQWTWIDGSNITNYKEVIPRAAECLYINPSILPWRIDGCGATNYFICEKNYS